MDKWRTMRAIEREFSETYGNPKSDEQAFTRFVMEWLMCPSYRDAEIAVFNYYKRNQEK